MSLYIRVANSFWNHRKTAKLRTVLGDDAFWIVPRLWSYASENQPDGDFSKYDSAEISMLLGCVKHASSIRQALIESGFMDETGCLHDWAEHNGYHAEYAERSRNAANARWEKERNRKEMKGKETSIASSMLQASKTPEMLKIEALFHRRESTAWNQRELKALPKEIHPDDLALVEAYYKHPHPKDKDYRRRDLQTLLNNWNGEVDRARAWKTKGSAEQPKASTYELVQRKEALTRMFESERIPAQKLVISAKIEEVNKQLGGV